VKAKQESKTRKENKKEKRRTQRKRKKDKLFLSTLFLSPSHANGMF